VIWSGSRCEKRPMKTSRFARCLALATLLKISACAVVVVEEAEPVRVLPQRLENPVELKPVEAKEQQLIQVLEVNTEAPAQVFLTDRQRLKLNRTPADALRDLAELTSQYDQDVDLCAGQISGAETLPVKRVAKPPHMTYYWDPAFRNKLIRVSDTEVGEVVKPMYSTIQSWNADESLMILYHSGGAEAGHHLYDGRTYEYIRNLRISPGDIEQVFWSHTQPNYFYYVNRGWADNNQLVRGNARSGKTVKLADLSPMCGDGIIPTSGNDVQMQSWDDDLFAFRCGFGGDADMYMHTYRVSTGEIRSRRIGQGTEWDTWNAPNPTASGQRLRMNGKVISPDLLTIERSLDMAKHNEHSSMGKTRGGDDALYAVAFDPSPQGCSADKNEGVGQLVEHNLQTGECRTLVTESMGYPYTVSGTHLSAVSHLRPGWVAMSSIGYPEDFVALINEEPAPTFFSEIYLVNTDPENPAICRLAQHRTFGKGAENGGYIAYLGEPHVTISPSGTRLLFGSDWYDSGAVDAYVLELPAYRQDLEKLRGPQQSMANRTTEDAGSPQ